MAACRSSLIFVSVPIRQSGCDNVLMVHIQEQAGYAMADDETKFDTDRRIRVERRSGADTRSEDEKRLTGERRSQIDRRTGRASEQPSNDQLALFAKRSGAPSETRAAATFSVFPPAKMISGAIPTSFARWTGLKVSRTPDLCRFPTAACRHHVRFAAPVSSKCTGSFNQLVAEFCREQGSFKAGSAPAMTDSGGTAA